MTLIQCLWQFSGFFIQFFPIAALVFVPFADAELRYGRKKTLALALALSLLFSALFTQLNWELVTRGADGQLFRILTNAYMAAAIVLSAMFYFRSVTAALLGRTLVLIILVFYAATLFILANTPPILALETQNPSDLPYQGVTVTAYAIALTVTLPLLYPFLRGTVRRQLPTMSDRLLRRAVMALLWAFALFILSTFILNTFIFSLNFQSWTIVLLLACMVLTDSFLCYIIFSVAGTVSANHQLRDELRSFNRQYREITNGIEQARTARHDLRHHLNVISAMNERGEQQALADYLKAYDAVYRELEDMPLSTNPVIDSILTYYIGTAAEYGIPVEKQIAATPTTSAFDPVDMTVLIGNIMENAIHACALIPDTQPRSIRVWMRTTDEALLLKVENTCCERGNAPAAFGDGSEFISGAERGTHGQGIKNVRRAAEKYGGSAQFKKSGGIFTVQVVLNLPQADELPEGRAGILR